jgi:hypothetical protein
MTLTEFCVPLKNLGAAAAAPQMTDTTDINFVMQPTASVRDFAF